MSPVWTIAAAAGWALTGLAWWSDHGRRAEEIADLRNSVAHGVESRIAMLSLVETRTGEAAAAIAERDRVTAGLEEAIATVREGKELHDEARAALCLLRERGEVAIAQAARWKTERDAAVEAAANAEMVAECRKHDHDVLQAKVERMTSGLQHGRKPKQHTPT